jgi:hypothetical protein
MAWIDKSSVCQLRHGFAILPQALALPHFCIPKDSQPAEVVAHRQRKILTGTLRIKIFISKPERAIRCARALCGDPEGTGVAKVQQASGRRGQSPHIALLRHNHPR